MISDAENPVATIIFGAAFVACAVLLVILMVKIARKNMEDDKDDEQ